MLWPQTGYVQTLFTPFRLYAVLRSPGSVALSCPMLSGVWWCWSYDIVKFSWNPTLMLAFVTRDVCMWVYAYFFHLFNFYHPPGITTIFPLPQSKPPFLISFSAMGFVIICLGMMVCISVILQSPVSALVADCARHWNTYQNNEY